MGRLAVAFVLAALVLGASACSRSWREMLAQRKCEEYHERAVTWLVHAARTRDRKLPQTYDEFEAASPLGNDPWGRPYGYVREMTGSLFEGSMFLFIAETVRVRSAGADGVPWTPDDIESKPYAERDGALEELWKRSGEELAGTADRATR